MPRRPRFSTGGYVFHVLNRAAGRRTIFKTDGDYQAFLKTLEEARQQVDMRLLCYCVMPNHWHLVLWPKNDGDLSEYMRWLTVTHTQRYHAFHETSGTGPLYQGRFKSFPVEQDDHFLTVCRYVQRNAVGSGLVSRAELWRWSSLWQETQQHYDVSLDAWPVPKGTEWLDYVNQPATETELAALRNCANRGTPYGNKDWQLDTAQRLGLRSTLRSRGRPRQET